MNLLHHCVLKESIGKTKFLIEFAQKEGTSPQLLKQWINAKQKSDGWTPLHYACFTGNTDAIYTLLRHGADWKSKNNMGLNMLHTAAQGDTPLPLYLFNKMGLDINSTDNRGSSPLHWACYSQCETVMEFILSTNVNLDQKDSEGYTPLHITVRSLDEYESCMPVRRLLISGASQNIKDNSGKIPSEYVDEVES